MTGRSRGPQRLAALALALLLGACSSGSAGTSARTSTTRDEVADRREQGVRFAGCIREHGVADFPDPDAKGEFAYGVSVSPAVWQAAVAACKDLEPPGALSAQRKPEEQSAALQFAQCVRDNGVPDFPDPANGDPLIDTTKIPSSNREGGMTILDAATAKCGDLLKKAAAQR